MTEIVLVRHGETFENKSGTLQGQDPRRGRLTPEGMAQASMVGRALAGEHFDRCYCSPLERAVLTLARVLEARRGQGTVPLAFPEALREVHMGALHGRTRDDWIAAAEAFGDRLRYAPEGGESWADVQTRAGAWFDGAVRPIEGERVLIVAHGGTIRAILTHLAEQDMAIEWAGLGGGPPIRNCSISRVRLRDGAVEEMIAGDTRHLGAGDAGRRFDPAQGAWHGIDAIDAMPAM